MKRSIVGGLLFLVLLLWSLLAVPLRAPAQQGPFVSWCPDVPVSPPPPIAAGGDRETIAGWTQNWDYALAECSDPAKLYKDPHLESYCAEMCQMAEGLWKSAGKPHALASPVAHPNPTTVPRSDGGETYLLPEIPPATPTATPTPAGQPQGMADPPGPFSLFAGADLKAISSTGSPQEPPDVAAGVSPTENAEFINYNGLYVWSKGTTTLPTPISPSTFWCGSGNIDASGTALGNLCTS